MFVRDNIAKLGDLSEVARTYRLRRVLRYMKYDQFAFKCYESEQSMLISRAATKEGENGIQFWIGSHCLEDWSCRESHFGTYLLGAEFKPISEKLFNDMVSECCQDLSTPIKLPIRSQGFIKASGFVGALLMYKTWDMVDIFAEYEDEYLHVYWDTTA